MAQNADCLSQVFSVKATARPEAVHDGHDETVTPSYTTGHRSSAWRRSALTTGSLLRKQSRHGPSECWSWNSSSALPDSFEEAMNLLSGVRLGVGVNLIPDVAMYTLNKLLVYTQPAHLAVAEGVAPTDADLPIRRARFVRKVLESEVGRRG